MNVTRPRIVLFSGMGVDHRLLDPQRSIPADIEVPAWIAPARGDTLASYAERLSHTFDTSRPFFLGGVSFGGMLAQEMSRHLSQNLRGLVLISTAESKMAIPAYHRLALRVGAMLPARAIARLKALSPFLRAIMGVIRKDDATLLNAIMRDADPVFLRWCGRAVQQWPGAPSVPPVPRVWVHGGSDFLLPIRRSRATHVIHGAGHLVNVTHASEVNAILSNWLEEQLIPKRPSESSVR